MLAIHLVASPAEHGVAVEIIEDLSFLILSCLIIFVVLQFSFRNIRRLEYAQQASEEKLRSLLHSMDDLVMTLDRELLITGVFGNWLRDRGLEPEVFVGRRLRDVFGQRWMDEQRETIHQVMHGTSLVREWPVFVAGRRTLFETSMTPLLNPSGVTVGVAVVARDVTSERESEETLRRYELLVENTGEMVFFLDEENRIFEINRAVGETLGFNREVLRTLPVEIVGDRPEVAEAILAAREDGTTKTFDSWFRRRDGESIPVEVSVVARRVGSEQVVMAVARDLTHRRRRELFRHLVHQINRRILHGDPLESVLRFVCEELVGAYGYQLIQVSLKGSAGEARVVEFAGEASGFIDNLNVRWDETPQGSGPTGTAIRTGAQQFSEIASDPRFAPWRERAIAFGLSSVVSMPLVSKTHVLGALTLFCGRDQSFDESDLEEIRGFADEIALSLFAAEHKEQIDLQSVALDAAPNAVVVTDSSGVIRWVNPAFTRLTGYDESEAIGKTPRILKSGRHPDSFYRQMWNTLLAGSTWKGELFNRRKDGDVYLEQQTIAPLRRDDGTISHFVAVKQDITSSRKQEERIAHLVTHDGLTNLPNRHPLEKALRRVAIRAGADRFAALLMLGVDNFSVINESYGHLVGDQVLMEIVGIISSQLRPGDFLARPGGDELAIVLASSSEAEAGEIAERLRRSIEHHPFQINGHHVRVTISVGLTGIDGTLDAEELLMKADSALYAAKGLGKNRIYVYGSLGLENTIIPEAGRWYSELNAALEESRFQLHFQPVIALANGVATHHEVLVRMIGSDGGLILPDRFIPAAERFGLMPQLDLWVIRNTIEVLERNPGLEVFVNLSASSLNQDEILLSISEMIGEANLPPGALAFEITETVALNDLIRAQEWITRLRDLGCSFALDDFGVGFSSFSSLRALSVDYVKVDRSFVRDIDTNATSRALVDAVRAVAHTLGKEVIAEGVETDAHVGVLASLGVEYGQGYFWGRPSATMATLEDVLS